MLKKLLLSFCIVPAIGFGQTITAANEFQIGDTQTMYMCDSAAPSYANITGTGVSWDYSTFFAVNNPDRIYQITANANGLYPNANKIVNIQGILSTYLKSNASNRSSDGFEYTEPQLGTIRANFSNGDNMNIMDYDFNFNAPINDLFTGTLTGPGTTPACSGTSLSVFDAVGTLKLSPSVTKTNVKRHHLYTVLNGTSIVGPVEIKINQFEYFDFPSSKLPVLSYTNLKIYTSGTLSSNLNFVLNTELLVNSATVLNVISDKFSIFPNPSESEIQLSSPVFNGSEVFEILDLTGKVIITSKKSKIDISSLNQGVYFIQTELNGSVSQQKFVKK